MSNSLNSIEKLISSAQKCIDDATIGELKTALDAIREPFEAIQKRFGKVDRETFDLDFDLKLFLGQIEEADDTLEIELLKDKIKDLLPKIRENAQKLSEPFNEYPSLEEPLLDEPSLPNPYKEIMNEKKSKEKAQDLVIVLDKPKAIKLKEIPVPAVLNKVAAKTSSPDALSAANKIISKEQEIVAQLEEAAENLTLTLEDAKKAEEAATTKGTLVAQQNKILANLLVEIETTALTEKNKREQFSHAVLQLGSASARLGQVEKLKSEFCAAEARAKNALLELHNASENSQVATEIVEVLHAGQGCELTESYEQIRQTKATIEQAVMITQLSLEQFKVMITKANMSLGRAETARSSALANQNKLECEVLQAEAFWLDAQEKFRNQQKVNTDCVNAAADAARQAESMRAAAHEAFLTHQMLALARAEIADSVRIAVQEAAEYERSRCLSELMAKGNASTKDHTEKAK